MILTLFKHPGVLLRLAVLSIPSHRSNKPHTIAFNSDGSLKFVELKIMNLRPPSEASFI